jgi:hypothetical protein
MGTVQRPSAWSKKNTAPGAVLKILPKILPLWRTQEGETEEEKLDDTKRHSPEYTEDTHAERDCQRQISP